MGLRRINAVMECDKCGTTYTIKVPVDADTDNCPTAFEVVRDHTDEAQREGSNVYEESGYHDGEFYGPCCWQEMAEELFIEEIKAGVTTEEHLRAVGAYDEYAKYLPARPALPSPEAA